GSTALLERASWRKCQGALDGTEASTTLIGYLIAAANCRFALAKPGKNPGETESGTNVVVVVRIDRRIFVRGIRTNELHGSVRRALARIHPARKIAAGNAECRVSSAHSSHRQSRLFVRNTEVVPAQ